MPLYEHRSQPVISRRVFVLRLLSHFALAVTLLAVSLAMGLFGYHYLVGLDWLDSLLNASMILGGMGPVNAISTPPGKVFASVYALFSGIVFLAVSAILVAPLAHRVLHGLHVEGANRQRP